MFERGRILGKIETETKWQIKDAGRRTREAVQTAAAQLRREREENWSELDSKELLQRLIDRKILHVEGGQIKDVGIAEAFGELCKQFLNNERIKPTQETDETKDEKMPTKKVGIVENNIQSDTPDAAGDLEA